MNPQIELPVRIALVGLGATAVMDVWLLVLQRMGVRPLDMALIGRWIAHAVRGRWFHHPIAASAPVRGERFLGWLVHYAVGIAFAAILAAVAGARWLHDPTPWTALAVGVATVMAPWLVMQPAMGAGIAASRTPAPTANRLRSLANHAVFGAGLYICAVSLSKVWP